MTDQTAPRIAAAPISWGVCEVPGWGHQMTPERVLTEMAELGLAATEFGPEGFLPAEADRRAERLSAHGLTAVGGFIPIVAHADNADAIDHVDAELPAFTASGADSLVLAAATGADGYDTRPELDDSQWARLLSTLDEIDRRAAARQITATLHPHVGTMVETGDEVARVLAGSHIGLCLDTGHLLVGGSDPVALARDAPGRIAHVHLKDVDAGLAADVRAGRVAYSDAVRDGLYRPLGDGDIDIAALLSALQAAGYDGWYVLEQDTMLTDEPAAVAGPIDDVARSLDFLRKVLG